VRRTYNTVGGRERWTMTHEERLELADCVTDVLRADALCDGVVKLDSKRMSTLMQLRAALLEV